MQWLLKSVWELQVVLEHREFQQCGSTYAHTFNKYTVGPLSSQVLHLQIQVTMGR